MTTPDDTITDPGIVKAEKLGVDYQKAGQVRALLAERENMVAYGNLDRVVAIDQALSAMGYAGDRTIGAAGDPGPLGRTSRADKTVRVDAPTASVRSDFLGPKTVPVDSATKGGTSTAATAGPADSPKPA